MSQTHVAIRQLVAAAFAGIASFGLCLAPAWSACSAPAKGPHAEKPFHADDELVYGEGVTWQRCSLGQHFDDGKCLGTPEKLNWTQAEKAAAAAGRGWRLPTQAELAVLVRGNCSAPATDTAVFPGTSSAWYWTATADGKEGAWFVDFAEGGGNGATLRTSLAAVRLVRNRTEERHPER